MTTARLIILSLAIILAACAADVQQSDSQEYREILRVSRHNLQVRQAVDAIRSSSDDEAVKRYRNPLAQKAPSLLLNEADLKSRLVGNTLKGVLLDLGVDSTQQSTPAPKARVIQTYIYFSEDGIAYRKFFDKMVYPDVPVSWSLASSFGSIWNVGFASWSVEADHLCLTKANGRECFRISADGEGRVYAQAAMSNADNNDSKRSFFGHLLPGDPERVTAFLGVTCLFTGLSETPVSQQCCKAVPLDGRPNYLNPEVYVNACKENKRAGALRRNEALQNLPQLIQGAISASSRMECDSNASAAGCGPVRDDQAREFGESIAGVVQGRLVGAPRPPSQSQPPAYILLQERWVTESERYSLERRRVAELRTSSSSGKGSQLTQQEFENSRAIAEQLEEFAARVGRSGQSANQAHYQMPVRN